MPTSQRLKGQENYTVWKKAMRDIIIAGRLGYYIVKDRAAPPPENKVFVGLHPGITEETIAWYADDTIIKTSIKQNYFRKPAEFLKSYNIVLDI
jgi:hypothetical protein